MTSDELLAHGCYFELSMWGGHIIWSRNGGEYVYARSSYYFERPLTREEGIKRLTKIAVAQIVARRLKGEIF